MSVPKTPCNSIGSKRLWDFIYNALLCSNSSTLAKILKADNAMNTINKKCRSAEFLDAFHGLERSGDFQHCVRTLQTVTSVACSNSRQKTRSFPVSLHANVFVEASICRLVSQFTTGIQNSCQSYWSFLFLPSLFWGCLQFFPETN